MIVFKVEVGMLGKQEFKDKECQEMLNSFKKLGWVNEKNTHRIKAGYNRGFDDGYEYAIEETKEYFRSLLNG